jgi:hypothetical protein
MTATYPVDRVQLSVWYAVVDALPVAIPLLLLRLSCPFIFFPAFALVPPRLESEEVCLRLAKRSAFTV